jgi:hypothetical protein
MLPQYSSKDEQPGLSKRFLKQYLFKMFRPHKKQMDFDLALLLML